jgi:hypothetical protein
MVIVRREAAIITPRIKVACIDAYTNRTANINFLTYLIGQYISPI